RARASSLVSPPHSARAPRVLSPFVSRSYRDHRDRHSFPTRRSSDLPTRPSTPAPISTRSASPSTRWSPAAITPSKICSSSTPARSEEHTFELQSRENIVCRLLLEKKKH